MAIEIERRFFLGQEKSVDEWERYCSQIAVRTFDVEQAYLPDTGNWSVRCRSRFDRSPLSGSPEFFITMKRRIDDVSCDEIETVVDERAWDDISGQAGAKGLRKTRYNIRWSNEMWEVDFFQGRLRGLALAEVELADKDQVFSLPNFIGAEVTGVKSLSNKSLSHLDWK